VDTTTPKFNIDVELDLAGPGGNAYSIMGNVMAAIKMAGATKEQVDAYIAESTSGDYDQLVDTAKRWCNVTIL
jgi:hypothetical protein